MLEWWQKQIDKISVCANWTRLLTSYISTFVVSFFVCCSSLVALFLPFSTQLEAHKFKQVLRKLHACHDNKTNCYDLWWGTERKEKEILSRSRFLWLDNICVEADLKGTKRRLKLTLKKKCERTNETILIFYLHERLVGPRSNTRVSKHVHHFWINCVTF